MSVYNTLFESAGKLKKAAVQGTKASRDAARKVALSAKQSEAWKSAGPALGKFAKYAAYPAGVGAGVGLGAWAGGAGIGAGLENVGGGVRQGFAPPDKNTPGGAIGGAAQTLLAVVVLLLLGYGVVRLYSMVKKSG